MTSHFGQKQLKTKKQEQQHKPTHSQRAPHQHPPSVRMFFFWRGCFLHTARRKTRMSARHPHKIFASPIGTATPSNLHTARRQTPTPAEPYCQQELFFFLRLPNGQYGPVSQLSWSEKSREAVQVHLIGAEPIVQVRT